MERGGEGERAVTAAVFPKAGQARVIGITGAPGAGKSSLVDQLVGLRRAAAERVAVLAVDPSSPVTGGALLGDRIRLQARATDPGLFVRSMASRGEEGGLAPATVGAVRVLDAAGWPLILVETVGAGQVEVDVADAADTTVVVVTPGWGDVQAHKAGILEVADVLVVNKADQPGADAVVKDLEASLDLGTTDPDWRPPVVRTVATTGEGIAELWDVLQRHRAFLAADGGRRLQARRAAHLAAEVRRRAEHLAVAAVRARDADALLADVAARRLDPLTAAERLASAGEHAEPSAGLDR